MKWVNERMYDSCGQRNVAGVANCGSVSVHYEAKASVTGASNKVGD